MRYEEIIKIVANEVNLPYEVVNYAYKSYWEFIKNTIQELPLKSDITEEEFNKLRTNFNIPSLGKLNCTFSRYNNLKKRLEYIKNIKTVENVKNK